MRWKVECITETSSNILIDDSNLADDEKEPIGMGFPLVLAKRIVKEHNYSLNKLDHALEKAITIFKKSIEDDYMDYFFEKDVKDFLEHLADMVR